MDEQFEKIILEVRIRGMIQRGWSRIRLSEPDDSILKLHATDPQGTERWAYYNNTLSVFAMLIGMEFDYLAENTFYVPAREPCPENNYTWEAWCVVPLMRYFQVRMNEAAAWSEPYTGDVLRGIPPAHRHPWGYGTPPAR